MIFVNTANLIAPLTQSQTEKRAYTNYAPGSMIGTTRMTGTMAMGYGIIGTMSGYPASQIITKTGPP